ncbi:hypothetical protein VCHA50P416_280017 [Vibrio chagasii]|nr:hypothetical protein VCHA50P416_280017 [Vibrio chagasii]
MTSETPMLISVSLGEYLLHYLCVKCGGADFLPSTCSQI